MNSGGVPPKYVKKIMKKTKKKIEKKAGKEVAKIIGKEIEFAIDRTAVTQYFQMIQTASFLPLVLVYGMGFILAVVYYFTVAIWLYPQRVDAFRYRLDSKTLRVDSGILFWTRKSIPVEQITDVVLVQGRILRYFDIWAMKIQTDSAKNARPAATLYGVKDPEATRDLILSRRDAQERGN